MRAIIYARVSKEEDDPTNTRYQEPENQLVPLRQWASTLGYKVVGEYVDRASGGSPKRPEFRRLLFDATQKKFDVVLVWAFDRFTREPTLDALGYVQRLKDNKVALKSLQESWLDTSKDNPASELLLMIFSWVAKEERRKISDRTKAAFRRMEAIGQSTGHRTPNVLGNGDVLDPIEVKRLYKLKHSYREIADHFNCSTTPIARIINDAIAKGELVR